MSRHIDTQPLAAGFTSQTLPTPPGGSVVYESGDGVPLVFLHGIGGGASSWTWIFVAAAFAGTHRVVVPDWVGWGASDHPSRFILFDDYVASLEALLDDLGTPAIVIAQSLAAGFALALAERRPDLFARLVLLTPSSGKDFGEDAFGPLARTTITPFAGPAAGFTFYRLLFHRRAFIGGWLRQEGFADPALVTRRIVDAFLFNARRENAAWSALPFANGSLRYDIAPLLRRARNAGWRGDGTQARRAEAENPLHADRRHQGVSRPRTTRGCHRRDPRRNLNPVETHPPCRT
ncbi:alpha/beta fold hydrolase [Sphingomonas sp. SUN019]|uniref:alpha/beta fold hydrolase n=1 Tax=Sphingomonas sp. SUN019 TaxID=2937788 RepID=UPI0021649A97|nr:alpha/beta fold hydrolase [Sphingomonas sp. SUN019]UVO50179.1 alpha/beta fold hydrolase [Sphingomonas sp. SUN019]